MIMMMIIMWSNISVIFTWRDFSFQVLLIIFSIVICCQARREDHDDDDDDDKMSYNDQFPIQPYREPPELQGHKNLSYDSGPYGSQPDIGVQYYRGDSRASQQLGYNDSVTYYQGRTDRYNGPPQGYRRWRTGNSFSDTKRNFVYHFSRYFVNVNTLFNLI